MNERSVPMFRRTWRQQLLFLLFVAAVLCGGAGSLAYWQGWLFLATFIACSTATGVYFARHDPALLERRLKVGPQAEQEPAQKIIIALLIVDFLLLLVLSALDQRWHWSNAPAWIAILGDAGIVAGFAIFFVVMKENSYAASTIRVEAGQPVVSTGPYALVRHPMYVGALLLALCTPLALGSYWSVLLIALAVFPVLGWRLIDEERVLRRDLAGYEDYCRKVRYRLFPGVW